MIRQLVGMLEALKAAVDNNEITHTKRMRVGEGQTCASSLMASTK